ncbi:MAG: glycosyl transferase, group 1 [Frankiales bacterium]|jgi:glycosyltransferase involved in cell wall biosynthesis|nr:glycosyl transferase, group 1 [Frankiales bacterium]
MSPAPHAVCLVGTAPPRRCGIATFTGDLGSALTALQPERPAVQVALTDVGGAYAYGLEVVFEVQAPQRSDYRTAAGFLNAAAVDVVCVQHEFGIFGGPAGRHVDELLDHLDVPVVTTLHTVLAQPSAEQRAATRRVADRSAAVVVLADRAVELLVEGCGIDPAKVRVIPHGVPAAPELDQDGAKASLGLTGRTLLLTFGLLGPDKGVEVVLDALPELVVADPSLLYVVLGATHPHVLRDHGDVYRESLAARVLELGLEDNVLLVDRYAELEELCRYLAASDVYVTPYHSTEQIVSGTLAYAVGMGCAVVSTPYPYAAELLAGGRGVLFPYRDSAVLAEELAVLLRDVPGRRAMQARAREHGRTMTWPAVAQAYQQLFAEVIAAHERTPVPWVEQELPAPTFAFLQAMTDDVGVFQHAQHGVPSRAHGYCTDDVSRALLAAVDGVAVLDDPVAAGLVPRYLSFLLHAQRPDGSFDNLMGYDRRFVPGTAGEDTLGQALWGLGTTTARGLEDRWRLLATELFEKALPHAARLQATKAVSYAVLGLHAYLERYPGALAARRTLAVLCDRLLERLADSRRDGWHWIDDALTYANAVVPEALLRAGAALERPDVSRSGLQLLDALLLATWTPAGFQFPGNEGWVTRDGAHASYGQQPIEAGLTARACVLAHEVSGDATYLDQARAAVGWLLGRNRLGLALYDPATGACADGLDRHGVSTNTGAESAVVALLGLLALPRLVPVELPGVPAEA